MSGIITPTLVREAYDLVYPNIVRALESGMTKRRHLAVVVTAVSAINPLVEGVPFENSCYLIDKIGDPDAWENPFDEFALSKAAISVRTGLPTAKVPPHQLLTGDTVFFGSVVLDGIVVACSGVEPWYDEMFSFWIAAAVQAKAKDAFEKFRDMHPEAKFIT